MQYKSSLPQASVCSWSRINTPFNCLIKMICIISFYKRICFSTPSPRRQCVRPGTGKPLASPSRSVWQHGTGDLHRSRTGLSPERPTGEPFHSARAAVPLPPHIAMAPTLPRPTWGGRQEPPRPGAQLRWRGRLSQPAGVPQWDGLPHGPRVCG